MKILQLEAFQFSELAPKIKEKLAQKRSETNAELWQIDDAGDFPETYLWENGFRVPFRIMKRIPNERPQRVGTFRATSYEDLRANVAKYGPDAFAREDFITELDLDRNTIEIDAEHSATADEYGIKQSELHTIDYDTDEYLRVDSELEALEMKQEEFRRDAERKILAHLKEAYDYDTSAETAMDELADDTDVLYFADGRPV